MLYLVQTGLMNDVGLFRTAGSQRYSRDNDVICRTPRGLEVGRVVTESDSSAEATAGALLRLVSDDDQMIINRIDRFKNRAFLACQKLLAREKINAMLIDVEHLFDGESVFFYFMGDVPDDVNRVSTELTELYDAKVKFRQFAEKLANGCGPGCGTTASKCGTDGGGCSTCSVSGGCGVKPKRDVTSSEPV